MIRALTVINHISRVTMPACWAPCICLPKRFSYIKGAHKRQPRTTIGCHNGQLYLSPSSSSSSTTTHSEQRQNRILPRSTRRVEARRKARIHSMAKNCTVLLRIPEAIVPFYYVYYNYYVRLQWNDNVQP